MTAGIVALFLVAPLVVVPLGLRLLPVDDDMLARRLAGTAIRASVPSGALLGIGFVLPAGLVAAALTIPWLTVAALTATAAVIGLTRDPTLLRPGIRHATAAARLFLAVGATFALVDRLGFRPFDFPATIVLLTAVHFHFAGFVLPIAGALGYSRHPARWIELALGVVILGIPLTALGFFGLPIVNWAGSMLVACGGFGIGIATWVVAGHLATRPARLLARIAAASLLLAMPMAATYSSGVLSGTTWLDLPTMARIHGSLNALGFAVPVIVAWSLDARARTLSIGPGALMALGMAPQ